MMGFAIVLFLLTFGIGTLVDLYSRKKDEHSNLGVIVAIALVGAVLMATQ